MKDYYNVRAISNSSLKWFAVSPRYFWKKFNEGKKDVLDTPALRWGKMVHKYILEPSDFDTVYQLGRTAKPQSQKRLNFCQQYISHLNSDNPHIKAQNPAIKAFKENYSTTGQTDATIEANAIKMVQESQDLIDQLLATKVLYNEAEYRRLETIKMACHEHKLAKQLLFEGNGVNELEIYWDYSVQNSDIELPCKSMLDRCTWNLSSEGSMKIIDLKTTSETESTIFKNCKVWEYGYIRQLAFYKLALARWIEDGLAPGVMDTTWNETEQDLMRCNWEYYLITVFTDEVVVYKIDNVLIEHEINQINDVMTKLAWHWTNNKWDYTKEYYDGPGYELISHV